MKQMFEFIKKTAKKAVIEYFMPAVVFYRYMTAPEDAKTISIEPPRFCGS